MLKPGGLMIVATLNPARLRPSALAKVGASGLRPALAARRHRHELVEIPEAREELPRVSWPNSRSSSTWPIGVVFDPLTGRWSQSHDADVNYMMTVTRDAA